MLQARCSPQDTFRRNQRTAVGVNDIEAAIDFKEILNGAIKAET